MAKFETLKQAGWTPIRYFRFEDIQSKADTKEKEAKLLSKLFEERRLDITKPHRIAFENERRAWFFLQDEKEGKIVTLDALKSHFDKVS